VRQRVAAQVPVRRIQEALVARDECVVVMVPLIMPAHNRQGGTQDAGRQILACP